MSKKTMKKETSAPAPENPSEMRDGTWVYAFRKQGEYPKASARDGKWLIFTPVSKVDAVWKKIREATEKGQLGDRSRASTGKGKRKFAQEPDSRVVEVYTYDADDKKDVMRIRRKLSALGFKGELHYKSEADSRAGNYSANVGKRVDRYAA